MYDIVFVNTLIVIHHLYVEFLRLLLKILDSIRGPEQC